MYNIHKKTKMHTVVSTAKTCMAFSICKHPTNTQRKYVTDTNYIYISHCYLSNFLFCLQL